MKEPSNYKPTETLSSEDVKPEEEKEILASIQQESFSAIPDQLQSIMSQCHLEAKVTPEDEKEITTRLKDEAATFVPDLLPKIMMACGLDNSMAPEDEKEVLSALGADSTAFVPNTLTSVKRNTGTYNPQLDQAALATQEKIHNEGEEIVPDVEKKVYEKTGAKKHFSFREFFQRHWLPLTSGFAAAAAAVAVVIIVPRALATPVSASGTYVSVTITPASSLIKTNTGSGINYEVVPTSYSLNKYTPTWGYFADGKNTVNASTFAPQNYSAKLLDSVVTPSLTSGLTADKVAAQLVAPSYQNGYLQNIQYNNDPVYNQISIEVYSSDASYSSTYQAAYKDTLNSALLENKVYADVIFTVTDLSNELSSYSTDEAQKIMVLYSGINAVLDSTEKLPLSTFEKLDTRVIDALTDVVSHASKAQLTNRGLVAVKQGLALAIKGDTSTMSDSDYEAWKKNMSEPVNARQLPWFNGSNLDTIVKGLQNEGYYLVGDKICGSDSNATLGKFQQVRNYLISKRTTTASDFVSLLNKTTGLIDSGEMPDGYNGEEPDNGHHDPGQRPGGDWPGGGHFTPEDGPRH